MLELRAFVRRAVGAALLFCVIASAPPIHAEGSRSMYPSSYPAGGFRSAMDLRNLATWNYMGIIPSYQFLYVYAEAGEFILVGSRNRNNGGDVLIYNPQSFGTPGDETRPGTVNFRCSTAQASAPAGSFSGTGRGIIASRAQELGGPNSADNTVTVTNGFSPCAYKAPSTGIYGVQFTVATSGSATNNGSVATPVVSDMYLTAWDVTVRSSTATSTADLPGRLFTYAWVGVTNANSRPVNYTLYYATSDGYRYEQIFRGADPNAAAFFGNAAGFLDQGAPLYKDVLGGTNNAVDASGFAPGVTPAQPDYPLFFSDIDDDVPYVAQVNKTLAALGIPLVPPVPFLTDATFVGNVGGNTSTESSGGVFQFNTQNTLTYEIVISAGSDFDPANTANRVLSGTALTGSYTVVWDGRNNAGTFFPAGSYQFRAYGRNGEIHFPILDIEGNPNGGPTLNKLNGGTGGSIVYFDDRGYRTRGGALEGVLNGHICGAGNAQVQPTPTHSLDGSTDSSVADGLGRYYRYWTPTGNGTSDCQSAATNAFGNMKGLDLWALERSSELIEPVVIIPAATFVDLGTLVGVTGSAEAGATVFGNLVFSHNGAAGTGNATTVQYVVRIGTPGSCPAGLVFSALPAGVAFVSQNAATCAVTFSGLPGTLTPGTTLNFAFHYTAPSTGPVPVSTSIDAPQDPLASAPNPPNQPAPNAASASTTILHADVAVDVTVPANAAPGATVNGTVVYENVGDTAANGTAFALSIGAAGSCPSAVTITPITVTFSYNAGTCVVTFLTGMPSGLAQGEQASLGISYTAPAAGTVPVTANITTTSPELVTANNTDNGSTSVASSADLAITKSGTSAVVLGGAVSYTLVVWNNGPGAINGALVSDTVPSNIGSVNWTCVGTGGANCTALSGTGDLSVNVDLPVDTGSATTADTQFVTITVTGTAVQAGSFTNTADVAPPAGTTDPTPGNDEDDQNTTVTATVDAVNDGPTNVSAAGGSTPSVIVNDSANGGGAVIGGNVSLAPGTSPQAGLTMNADGTITVAAGTPAGSYGYPYTICLLPPNTGVCDTATATVVVQGTIDAVNDGPTNVPASGGSTPSVIGNDTINGVTQANIGGNVALTPGTSPNAGLTMNPDGTITVAAGTPAATYSYPYTICQLPPNGSICDTANASVVVQGAIDAVDDGPTNVSAAGGSTPSVIGNDTINGTTPANIGGNVTLAPGTTPHAGLTMNPDGTITVAAGTPAGSYGYPYTICHLAPNAAVCDSANATVVVAAAPQLAVIKNGALSTDNGTLGLADAGDVITYSVTVQNTGNVTISSIAYSDSFEGGASQPLTCAPTTLLPGQSAACNAYTHTVTQPEVDAGQPLDNVATATGTDPGSNTVTDDDDASIPVAASAPQITVTKNAVLGPDSGTPGLAEAGDVITYSVTVQNTGNQTVSGLAVQDSYEGGASQALTCSPAVLPPGATATCNVYTHIVTQPEIDAGAALDNIASATATPPVGPPVTDADDTSTPVAAGGAQLTVTKNAVIAPDTGTPGMGDVGDVITYSVSVANTGNVSVDEVAVNDSYEGGTSQPLTCAPLQLAPGQTATCNVYTHTVTQAEVDAGATLDNVATATATPPSGPPVTDGDDSSTPVAPSAPQLTVTKNAMLNPDNGTPGLADAGDVISYSVTVQNTGNVTITGLAVQDAFEGGTAQSLTCAPTTLPPGATATCNPYTHTVTQPEVDAGGTLDNIATAQGNGPGNTPVESSDSTSTPVPATTPQLTVNKIATLSPDNGTPGVADAGDVINYAVTVQNSGNATIGAISVDDSFEGGATVMLTCSPSMLAPGQSATCNAYSHTVTQAEVDAGGMLDNVATARGNDPGDNPVSDSDDTATPVPGASADLSIVKTASTPTPQIDGAPFTFTLTAANAGPSTATGVTVQDLLPAGYAFVGAVATQGAYDAGTGLWTVGTLLSGANATLTITVTANATGPYANTATIDSPLPDPDPSDDTDTETPSPAVGQADLAVLKTGPAQILRGNNVEFTIVVTNRGPDAAINARLADPTPAGLVFVSTGGACSGPFPCALGDIAANESRTLTATYFVPAGYAGPNMIVNTVNALSDSADPTPGDSSSSSSVLVPGGVAAPSQPVVIPVDARWALLLMASLMALFAARGLRPERVRK